jgi:D-threo-aldose 1-dehydrogenase
VLDAYRALDELKAAGELAGVGIASRDWKTINEIDARIRLDWVMLVGGVTIMHHPPQELLCMSNLAQRQIPIIAAGNFHGDFLLGGSSFDARAVDPENPADRSLFAWRKVFVALCHGHGITPVQACLQFALAAPGVVAVAVSTSRPERIAENARAAITKVPPAFWDSMKEEGLLASDYPYLD